MLRPTVVALAAAGLLAACGGGGGDDASQPPPTRLSGVVATGAALAGATVTVRDSSATTADVTATAGADGNYSVDIGGLVAPLLVLASGTLDGEPVSVAAVVPTLSSGAVNTANVTSLTTAVAGLVVAVELQSATPANLAAQATSTQVANATQLVVNTLRTDATISAALGATFDPLTTAFTANSAGIDAVLDRLRVESSDIGVVITSLAASIGAGGAQASVTLTPAQTAAPTAVPTLPASPAATALPTAARMAALAKKLGDCLALPVEQRVTLDAAGDATAVSATCNFAPAGWRSNGRDWVSNLGNSTFSRGNLTGTKVGQPIVDAVFAPANESGNVFQHPYCNTDTCVVMRVPGTTPSGAPVSFSFLLGKVGGAWDFVGNQRPIGLDISHRVERKVQVNPAKATSTAYLDQDRVKAVVRLIFDHSVGTTDNIRAVRWKGPGLPAAGVVTVRSNRCSTADRFGITNQEGSLDVNNQPGVQQFWASSSATQFVLSAAKLDGSAITMPVPTSNWATTAAPLSQDFSPTPFTGSVPAYSVYTAEVFTFSNTGTTPDVVYKLRNGTPYETAASAAGRSWPTLAASTIAST